METDEQHRLQILTSKRQSIRAQRFEVKQVSRGVNIWNTVERTGEPGGTKYTTYTCWIYCSTHGTIERCSTYCTKGVTVVRDNN